MNFARTVSLQKARKLRYDGLVVAQTARLIQYEADTYRGLAPTRRYITLNQKPSKNKSLPPRFEHIIFPVFIVLFNNKSSHEKQVNNEEQCSRFHEWGKTRDALQRLDKKEFYPIEIFAKYKYHVKGDQLHELKINCA